MENKLEHWILYDNQNEPETNKFIVFIGKMGKVGVGLVEMSENDKEKLIRCGNGQKIDIRTQDLYAWKYIDIPEEILQHFRPLIKTFGFSKIMMDYIENMLVEEKNTEKDIRKNPTFLHIQEQISIYDTELTEWQNKFARYREMYGNNTENISVWLAENPEPVQPVSDGEISAYLAWLDTIERESDILYVSKSISVHSVRDFIKTLKKAGIHEFIYCDLSITAVDTIHRFLEEGCVVAGIYQTVAKDRVSRTEIVKGFHVQI